MRRRRVASVGSHRRRLRLRGPESTRSPIKTRAYKDRISDAINGLTFRHVEEPRASDLRRDGRLAVDSPLDRDPTATMKSYFSLSSQRSLEHRIPIRRRRRFMEEHHDRGPIEPRSWRDRAAIVDPSAWNLFHDHRSTVLENLEHDRRPIVVDRGRSRRRSWPILKQFLRLIHLQIGADSMRI